MKPPRTLIFGVEKSGITITSRGKRLGIAKNKTEMLALVLKIRLDERRDIVMFSSSMDFAEEYTKNKTILALVERLHGMKGVT